MTPLRLFISSVQKELAEERAALRDFLRGDPLMRRFFEVFLFEEVPAADRPADQVYLTEVERSHLVQEHLPGKFPGKLPAKLPGKFAGRP